MNKVFREEQKYVLTQDVFYHLRHQISKVLHRDKHSEREQFKYSKGDGYTIRSLYFDCLEDRDFHEKVEGIELRRKCRLRTYMNDTSFCVLELKKKQGHLQQKTSFRLTREQGERLIDGDYGMLLEMGHPFLVDCYQMMTQHVYKPKAVVTYERDAFVAKENKIRITFDQKVRGTESDFNIFSETLNEYFILDPRNVVLEVKFNGFLLQYIKDILADLERHEQSVSKYCLARQVSKHYYI